MEQYSKVQQLLKKEEGQKNRLPIYPSTVIQAVFDGKTGASLEAILAQFNSIYIQYQGSPEATRNIIPVEMRRAGLTITYMNMDSETITERATSAVQKDNDHWSLNINWTRVDELSLSGDIAVSANGTWIINGEDTGVKAVGPKGDAGITPWLKTIDNKLHFSYDNVNWEPCSDNIAAYFRFNTTSSDGQGLSVGKFQISRDNKNWEDLSPEITNTLRIAGYVATSSALPSGKPVGTIFGVGPTFAAEDTAHTNPIYRLYVYDGSKWVDNGTFTSIAAGVVQETGDSETLVMSQKATTAKLSELASKVGISQKTCLSKPLDGVLECDIYIKDSLIGSDCIISLFGWASNTGKIILQVQANNGNDGTTEQFTFDLESNINSLEDLPLVIKEYNVYSRHATDFLHIVLDYNYMKAAFNPRVAFIPRPFSSYVARESILEDLDGKVEILSRSINGELELVEPTNILSSSAIKTDGTIASVSGTGFKVFEYNVVNGEVYSLFNKTSNVGTIKRLSIAAYNDLGELVEALASWPTSNSIGDDNLIREIEYKVPSGVSVIKMGNLSGEQYVARILKKGITHEIDEIQEDVKNNGLRIENLESSEREQKIFNPYNDLRKDSLKVLHIGNSFMNGSLVYLNDLINAADIDVSNMCLYACYRGGGSFKSWVDCWNDLDTDSYSVGKRIGGIEQNITGSSSANNGEKFRNTIKNNRWDYIIIQQASAYANNYSVWETESDGGYLVELIRLLKIYQPQATIGYNMVHSSPRDNSDLLIGFNNIADATKRLNANYGIDFIIPYGTAIQNIRLSNIASNTLKGFCKDGHHLGRGVGNYVASATYFQALFAPRYGVSILGNTFRAEVTSEDLSDAAYPSDVIPVTDENAYQCQMATILACCNMWEVVNPDNVSFHLK